MRKLNTLLFVVLMTAMSSCAVIGGIFKAGVAVGVIVIVVIIFLLIWIISLFKGKS